MQRHISRAARPAADARAAHSCSPSDPSSTEFAPRTKIFTPCSQGGLTSRLHSAQSGRNLSGSGRDQGKAMAKRIEDEAISHSCWQCGAQFKKKIRWLEARSKFACPAGCGAVLTPRRIRIAVVNLSAHTIVIPLFLIIIPAAVAAHPNLSCGQSWKHCWSSRTANSD